MSIISTFRTHILALAAIVVTGVPVAALAATCGEGESQVTLGLGVIKGDGAGAGKFIARCLFMDTSTAGTAAFCGFGKEGSASGYVHDAEHPGTISTSSGANAIPNDLPATLKPPFPDRGIACLATTVKTAADKDALKRFLTNGDIPQLARIQSLPEQNIRFISKDKKPFASFATALHEQAELAWKKEATTVSTITGTSPQDSPILKAVKLLHDYVRPPGTDNTVTTDDLPDLVGVVKTNFIRIPDGDQYLRAFAKQPNFQTIMTSLQNMGCVGDNAPQHRCEKWLEVLKTNPQDPTDYIQKSVTNSAIAAALALLLTTLAAAAGWVGAKRRATGTDPAILQAKTEKSLAEALNRRGSPYTDAWGGTLSIDDELAEAIEGIKRALPNDPAALDKLQKFRLRWLLSKKERTELRTLAKLHDPTAGAAECVRALLDSQERMRTVIDGGTYTFKSAYDAPDRAWQSKQSIARLTGCRPEDGLDRLKGRLDKLEDVLKRLPLPRSPSEAEPTDRIIQLTAAIEAMENERHLVDDLVRQLSLVQSDFRLDTYCIQTFSNQLQDLLRQVGPAKTLIQAIGQIASTRQFSTAAEKLFSETLRGIRGDTLESISPDRRIQAMEDCYRGLTNLWQATAHHYPDLARDGATGWSRILANLAALSAELGGEQIATLPQTVRARQQQDQHLIASGQQSTRVLAETAHILGAEPAETPRTAAMIQQKLAASERRCDELQPYVQNYRVAEDRAKALDDAFRPALLNMMYVVPSFDTAETVRAFAAKIYSEDPHALQLRLSITMAAVRLGPALESIAQAGREDVIRLLGFANIEADLRKLFSKGTVVEQDQVWSDLLLPGLMSGAIPRVLRAKVLIEMYFGDQSLFAPLLGAVTALAYTLKLASDRTGVKLTVPAILCPAPAGVDIHSESMPELRAVPEIRSRLADHLARREPIVVDIHNVGVVSDSDSMRPGVVVLNPAEW